MNKRSSISIINSTIFVVDDNRQNLDLIKSSLPKSYEVFLIQNSQKLLELIYKKVPDLILLDIDMPELSGFEAIKAIKSDPKLTSIPIIFLSGRTDADSLRTGLELGADDYIIKPVLPKLLQKSVELQLSVVAQQRLLKSQLKVLDNNAQQIEAFETDFESFVEDKIQKVMEQQFYVLNTVSKLVEYRNEANLGRTTRDHRGLAIMIKALRERRLYADQIKDWDMEVMLQSARLHDVGKLAISTGLLSKPGKLTSLEYEEVKKHPTLGVRILSRMETLAFDHALLKYAKVFAETHQERWDGSGYPCGLAGEDIPLPGRLMAINVVYHALTGERPYKKPLSHDEAVQVIIDGQGTLFDPVLVDVFSQVSDEFKNMSSSLTI
ncbi:MAG: response regulator [Deltaproteobacteria bacterium]|jgi:putative two-component system response regulator|nr:response regulator [Deltaproteobacteria bacterium]